VTLPPRDVVTRWAGRVLFAAGGLCLGLAVLGWAEAAVFQWVLDWRLERALNEGAGVRAPSSPSTSPSPSFVDAAADERPSVPVPPPRVLPGRPVRYEPAPDSDAPIGRLTAPRLGLSAVVAEGISGRTLRRAVGHIPGTALPWEDGTVGLAAHRDTFFRRLKDVQVGDTFRLTTPQGSFEYVVRSLDIVTPDRADLLEPAATPRLALVTCYPFSVVGPAPSRFVVTADRVDAPPVRTPRAALWEPLVAAP
jgi:sortase A